MASISQPRKKKYSVLKAVLGIILAILVFCIILAVYERINGGPWYTYKNFNGDRVIMGATERTTFLVQDENGNPVEIVSGWKFPGAPNDAYVLVKDSKGDLYFKKAYFPAWMEISQAILYPFLWTGHLVVDRF